jgi:glutaredoxin 3
VKCKDADELKAKLQEHKLRIPKVQTFPRIYDGKKLIGGADSIEKHYSK